MNKPERLTFQRRIKQHRGTREERALFSMGYLACLRDLAMVFEQTEDRIANAVADVLRDREHEIVRVMRRI